MANWINTKGPEGEIILSSRVRLARNFKNYNFPQIMTESEAEGVIEESTSVISKNSEGLGENFKLIRMKDISKIDRVSMVEKHLISNTLIDNYKKSAVLLNNDLTVSIMLNEEDHIRLQVIYPGLQLKEAYECASKIDDFIEDKIDYAFNQKMGYLTSCPTNIGTGMRASVMMHLPALSMTGNINGVLNAVAQVGLAIRGLYGEGSNIQGNIYQISNQITLGLSEEDIISNLIAVTRQIVEKEKLAREKIIETNRFQIEDNVFRAYGILKNSRILSSSECMNLLSYLRLGIELNIIEGVDFTTLNELMVNTQRANLIKLEEKDLSPELRDIVRAKYVREKLK